MTFREFFNKRDNQPIANTIGVPKVTGMTVVQDFVGSHSKPSFYTDPKPPKPPMPKQPTSGILPYRRPLSDRPVESKPTDFLARKQPGTKS